MKVYRYKGPVTQFGKIKENEWEGKTQATSEKKAKSNLMFRYKNKNGLALNAKIELPGELEILN